MRARTVDESTKLKKRGAPVFPVMGGGSKSVSGRTDHPILRLLSFILLLRIPKPAPMPGFNAESRPQHHIAVDLIVPLIVVDRVVRPLIADVEDLLGEPIGPHLTRARMLTKLVGDSRPGQACFGRRSPEKKKIGARGDQRRRGEVGG